MKRFDYSRPTDLESAVATLAAGGEGTRLIAGGTTMFDLMKLGVETPSRIVDINNLSKLKTMETSSN